MDAARLISSAISVGVPLFNSGDAAGCAAIYSNTLGELMDAAPQAVHPRLITALEKASASTDDSARAWVLRHALDDVLSCLRGGASGAPPHSSGHAAASLDMSSLEWTSVDDRVMGGSSRSRMTLNQDNGAATFEGNLVVAGGGFASVRANLPTRGHGMAGATGLIIHCSGDDRTGYKVSLKTDMAWDGVSYQAAFSAPMSAGPVRVPFSAFRATFRGQPVPRAPPLQGDDVCVVGLMLSRFDSQSGQTTAEAAGPFRLQVHSIGSY